MRGNSQMWCIRIADTSKLDDIVMIHMGDLERRALQWQIF